LAESIPHTGYGLGERAAASTVVQPLLFLMVAVAAIALAAFGTLNGWRGPSISSGPNERNVVPAIQSQVETSPTRRHDEDEFESGSAPPRVQRFAKCI
jgi:hypothetical protein